MPNRPTIFYPDLQIAPLHNNAAALRVVEDIQVGTRYLVPPLVYGSYDPGVFRVRNDGTLYIAGFGSVRWVFSVMWRDQFRFLQTTYCGGSYSGSVTIRTRLDNDAAAANYNAIMRLPKLKDTRQQITTAVAVFTDVEILFTRLVAI